MESLDVLLVEIGGTIGDPESEMMFRVLNDMRQRDQVRIHTVMVSQYFSAITDESAELSYRSKITRQAHEKLIQLGLHADSIILRTKHMDDVNILDTNYIATETAINKANIFLDPDCDSIYELPEYLRTQNMHLAIAKSLSLELLDYDAEKDTLKTYATQLLHLASTNDKVRIGIYGKTVSNDSYVSLREAVSHACVALSIPHTIVWLDEIDELETELLEIDCCIVGEGLHDLDQKKSVIGHCQKTNKPCLCISFGTDVLTESIFDNTCIKSTALTTGEIDIDTAHENFFLTDKKERFRYNTYIPQSAAEKISQKFTILGTTRVAGDIVLIQDKKYPNIIGAKYHPEYISQPNNPHPLFLRLITQIKYYGK